MIAVMAFVFLSGGSMAIAQMQPMKPAQPSQGQTPGAAQKPTQQPGQPMMGQGMMGMMCPMMGQGMMGGMMSMSDPKAQARMLKLHGDMMKAMGEVMLKHGQALEQEK
jgi:hypothetical protein